MSGVITQNIRINTNIESDHNASYVLITFSLIVSLCFFNSLSISQKVLVLLQKCDFIIYQPNKIQYIYMASKEIKFNLRLAIDGKESHPFTPLISIALGAVGISLIGAVCNVLVIIVYICKILTKVVIKVYSWY